MSENDIQKSLDKFAHGLDDGQLRAEYPVLHSRAEIVEEFDSVKLYLMSKIISYLCLLTSQAFRINQAKF